MKKHFRSFFIDCKKILKMSYFLDKCNISGSNFSSFVAGDDTALSDEKIYSLFSCIMEEVDRILFS